MLRHRKPAFFYNLVCRFIRITNDCKGRMLWFELSKQENVQGHQHKPHADGKYFTVILPPNSMGIFFSFGWVCFFYFKLILCQKYSHTYNILLSIQFSQLSHTHDHACVHLLTQTHVPMSIQPYVCLLYLSFKLSLQFISSGRVQGLCPAVHKLFHAPRMRLCTSFNDMT